MEECREELLKTVKECKGMLDKIQKADKSYTQDSFTRWQETLAISGCGDEDAMEIFVALLEEAGAPLDMSLRETEDDGEDAQNNGAKKKRKKAGKKGKKESEVGYYRRDQPITLSDTVEFKAIYELLEKVEISKQLMYVTDIEMTRDFQDGAVARKNATFTVSTFYYKGGRE